MSLKISPHVGILGRSLAMNNISVCYRAWCVHVSVRDGQEYCHVLFVDYGNSEEVLKSEVFLTNTHRDVWTLPPIARPFKLQGMDSKSAMLSLNESLLPKIAAP